MKGRDLNKAQDDNDRIVYDKRDGELRYDPDGQGGAKGTLFAILDGSPNKLQANDFVVVA